MRGCSRSATAASAAAKVLKNMQTDTSMQHDGIVDEEPTIFLMGTKHTRLERSPRRGDMMPSTQDESGLRPSRKNQHVAASNTGITFRCLEKLDDIDMGMLLSPLTVGISAGLMGIAYESILQDPATQVCTITSAQPAAAA